MVSVIILAGGVGKRLGGHVPKQLIKINNKTILEHTIDVFHNMDEIEEIVLVCLSDEIKNIGDKYKKVICTKGGDTRQSSVYNGLQKVTKEIVLIHDGVRPFVSKKDIIKIIEKVKQNKNVVIGTKVKDTIKVCNGNKVLNTLKRENLWAVQTPQGFKKDIILEAHKKALENNYIGTDDTSLIENMGLIVEIVEGNYNNIKITTKEDINIAKMLFEKN